jgi:hypothetical protein
VLGRTGYFDNLSCKVASETTVTVTYDWTRVATASATITNPPLIIRMATSGDAIDVALFQNELGAFITSPIPTVASQVTRAADNIRILTSAFPYNQPAGTLVVDALLSNRLSSTAAGFRLAELSNGAANRVIDLYTVTAAGLMQWYNGTAIVNAGTPTADPNKVAVAYATGNYASSLNGAAAVTNASALVNTATNLYIGMFSTGIGQLNGHIKRLDYYAVRKSNAELQVLSS